jgi:hypothetical protein
VKSFAHFCKQLSEGSYLIGENVAFRSGNPFQPEALLLDSQELQDTVRFLDHLETLLITSQVMAVAEVSARDQHAVGTRFKRL